MLVKLFSTNSGLMTFIIKHRILEIGRIIAYVVASATQQVNVKRQFLERQNSVTLAPLLKSSQKGLCR